MTLPAAITGNPGPRVMASVHSRLTLRAATITDQTPGYSRKSRSEWVVIIGWKTHPVKVRDGPGQGDSWLVEYDEHEYVVEDGWSPMDAIYTGEVNGATVDMQLERNGFGFDVTYSGCLNRVFVVAPSTARLNQRMPVKQAADQSRYLLSPMPGAAGFVIRGSRTGGQGRPGTGCDRSHENGKFPACGTGLALTPGNTGRGGIDP